jgi:phosphoribosylamine-glycine ligase
MNFVIATRDYSGLGFAVRLKDEGHGVVIAYNPDPDQISDPKIKSAYDLVGCDMVEKAPLQQLMQRRESLHDWYWIWDHNHSVEENETLRSEGFKVFGGGEHANCMEHDRNGCLEFAATYGLEAPPSFPFDRPEDAITFCREHRTTAYVYKPDQGENFETFLPESEDAADANFELQAHLATLEAPGPFILQERKEGVETNVEVWFQDGDPVFAFMSLESKRKCVMDLGELVGCAFDFVFTIPLDSLAVKESVGKLYPAYKRMRYTGFSDANFIAARDGVWFFEKCERFGYNAHPNLFFNLSRKGTGEVLASLVDGAFRPDFSGGFGASVTMSTKENPTGGNAIQFPEKIRPDIFFWDAYRKGNQYRTAGYDRNGYVLILLAYGYTMPTAWESLMKKAGEVKFPYRQYRTDGDRTNYPSSPIRRYEALKAMAYI